MATAPDWNSLSPTPPAQAPDWNSLSTESPSAPQTAAPDWNDLQTPQEYFSSPEQQLKTSVEQGLSGLTAGASKVIETKALGVNPQNIQAREEANPTEAFLSNLVGTGALLTGSGGLGLEAEAGSGVGKLILSNAAQGSILGGVNSVTNDLSMGDPNLNASKII